MQRQTKAFLLIAVTFVVAFSLPLLLPRFFDFFLGSSSRASAELEAWARALNGGPEKPYLVLFHFVQVVFASGGS